jgi:hypothetical protein
MCFLLHEIGWYLVKEGGYANVTVLDLLIPVVFGGVVWTIIASMCCYRASKKLRYKKRRKPRFERHEKAIIEKYPPKAEVLNYTTL